MALMLLAGLFCSLEGYAQENSLDELLDLSLEELIDVQVVTATRKSQSISEVPATVRVITAEQIKLRGYLTLEDALGDLPGIQFRNIAGFNSYSFVRGVPSQNHTILMMVDGVQINELNSGGYYGGGHFNLSNVKAIEIVYGPASALYGTNALSGIINIITNDPGDVKGGHISLLAGSFNTRNVDFKLGSYDEESGIGFVVSGMFKQSDKQDLRGAKGDNNWTGEMENFEDDLALDGKISYNNLTAGFVFQDKQASRTTNYKAVGTDFLDHSTKWHIQFINGYMNYEYSGGERWEMNSRLYYRNATVKDNTVAFIKSTTGPTGGQTGYYRPNSLIGFEYQLDLNATDKLSLIAGFVLEREKLAEGFSRTYSGSASLRPPAPVRPVMLSNHLESLFVQAQHELAPYLTLFLGIRYDISSYYGNVTTPRFGLVFNRDRLAAKLLYMQAFRAPRPWDYTFGVGNSHLDPEEMSSWEYTTTYSFTDNLLAGLAFYDNSIDGKFTNMVDMVTNGDRLDTRGVELTLDYKRDGFESFLYYTYTSSKWNNGDMVPEIGKNAVSTGVLLELAKNVKLSLRGHYISRRKNVNIIPTTGVDYVDNAFIATSTLSVLQLKDFDIHLTVNNLFDTEYYHTSNRPPARYRQPQRQFIVKTTYNF